MELPKIKNKEKGEKKIHKCSKVHVKENKNEKHLH